MTITESKISPICDFFEGKSVFITGATGLVGKILVEKLLRTCTGINKIYILLRVKKGQPVHQRYHQFVSSSLFIYIDKSLLKKVVPVAGDIADEGLGINEDDLASIKRDVSIVFHSAATIRFTAPLKTAMKLNVIGTQSVINLCRQLDKLDAFVHVSTAYCNPNQAVCEEAVYEPPIGPEKILEFMRMVSEEEFKEKSKEFIGDFPNTYSYTKNLAEYLVKTECEGKMPVTIVRPSIVGPSIREPVPGWVDSINGITGGGVLAYLGIARTAPIRPLDLILDSVPVDIVANASITAAWIAATEKKNELTVYNVNSSNLGGPTFRETQVWAHEFIKQSPSIKTIRPPAAPLTDFDVHPVVFTITKFFTHTLFAFIVDTLLMLMGQKRVLGNVIRRLHKAFDVLVFFIERKFNFTNHKLLWLEKQLKGDDKDLFNFDIAGMDWYEYSKEATFGTRRYLLKEPDSNIPQARRRLRMLNLGYSILNLVIVSLLWYIFIAPTTLGKVISSIFSYYLTIVFGYVFGSASVNNVVS